MSRTPAGLNPVEVLVSILSEPEPAGLGIEYDWMVSASAESTLTLGRGNCVSLAMLLVGLGRSLDWPIYFAEARPHEPVLHQLPELNILSSHMIVIVLTQNGPVFVDFLGLINQSDYDIHPIDDISAYAHLLNNIAAQELTESSAADTEQWTRARKRFEYVTRIQPQLGDAWNNLGIAHARLEQYALARRAYGKAIQLDQSFGSSEKNLTIMETRAANRPAIVSGELSD